MTLISNILYWISTGLLVPVIVILIIFFIRAMLLIGSSFGQYIRHRHTVRSLIIPVKRLTPQTLDEFARSLDAKPASPEAACAAKIIAAGSDQDKIDLLLSEYELNADSAVVLPATLAKIGPILGLSGTLIPMGPALVGLASGDISSMAYNMQVAFATTVVGLVICAVGLLTRQARERWSVETLCAFDYLAAIVRQANDREP